MKNKGLIRLAESLYASQWAITPAAYQVLTDMIRSPIEEYQVEKMIAPVATDDVDEDGSMTAVIQVSGIFSKNPSEMEEYCLGMLSVDSIKHAVEQAVQDPSIRNIVLHIDSPGGEVTGTEELGRSIRAANDKKKIYAYTDANMCSAAYWIASQCEAIGMSPSANVGSIGVYTLVLDQTKAMEQKGISVNAFSAGDHKMMGHSFRTLSDDERTIIQAGVDKQYASFKATVLAVRPNVPDSAMQGLSYDGEDAMKNNLVDSVADSLDQFISTINTKQNMTYNKVNAVTRMEAPVPVMLTPEVVAEVLPEVVPVAVAVAPEAVAVVPVAVAAVETPTNDATPWQQALGLNYIKSRNTFQDAISEQFHS